MDHIPWNPSHFCEELDNGFTLDSLRQKSPSLMAGMLWNGLIARYSGWKMEFVVEIFKEKILHLHVFSRQEIALLELVRHANHLGCHLHNPTKKTL